MAANGRRRVSKAEKSSVTNATRCEVASNFILSLQERTGGKEELKHNVSHVNWLPEYWYRYGRWEIHIINAYITVDAVMDVAQILQQVYTEGAVLRTGKRDLCSITTKRYVKGKTM